MQRNFSRRTILCLIPLLIATLLVGRAYMKYRDSGQGFKLGIDLVGGTILVYELDQTVSKAGEGSAADVDMKELAAALKRRLDPADLKNVTIRPVGSGKKRIEIILPTVAKQFGGDQSTGDADSKVGTGKKNLNQEEIEEFKKLIQAVGSLEFRMLANDADTDDKKGIQAAQEYLENPANKDILERAAIDGVPPPGPSAPDGEFLALNEPATYSWAPIDDRYRTSLGLQNANEGKGDLWMKVAEARKEGKAYLQVNRGNGDEGEGQVSSMLIYSRECKSLKLSQQQREERKYEYFILTRSSDSLKVGGSVTITAREGNGFSNKGRNFLEFTLNSAGSSQFAKLTRKNKPSGDATGTKQMRQFAIILDGLITSAPQINSPITGGSGIIEVGSIKDVREIVQILKSGALPASLKPLPVSENTIGATLGEDTIKSGTWAVFLAFVAVLIFMVIYYRFAGLVASLALLANLLLTVGFMVAVNATFTLPGLAGLVLMLGMAVDANVLIYERLREERDRGNSIATALRNGYDRAFPTIIDTHLSSIFTAIVLYTVGNDQLKGFGVSLTAGLIISLFTSLFMTRLIFDYCLHRNWLKQLRMLRFFSKPSIDFMAIRKLMFTATAILTILGLGLFLARGSNGLNVDFVGGTAYGGQFKTEKSISELRHLLSDERQKTLLAIDSVKSVEDPSGKFKNIYAIKYKDGSEQQVTLANPPLGETTEQKEAAVAKRASQLPDWSVEQIFLQSQSGSNSRYFTVRTTEMEPELVQIALDRLCREGDTAAGASLLLTTDFTITPKDKHWLLNFIDPTTKEPVPTSPSFVKTLLEREFRTKAPEVGNADLIDVRGEGAAIEGRYTTMRFDLADNPIARKLNAQEVESLLKSGEAAFASRPQPERLETFDSTLADETKNRAVYAILASWLAILLYLWFRFGSWTFGAAAVICLIHDLCFTLGAIAICYYVHDTAFGKLLGLKDFKIDLPAVAALLTLVGYSVNDTIVVFDRIREVRGKNPKLTEQMINDSVNQTLSRTLLASLTTWLVVIVLYAFGGDGVHLFAFVMVIGVIVGTYSSIYIASPLLLIFGEGVEPETQATRALAAAAAKA
ncbi:protein translocase subunit SecD [Telmatocola sphagniphila]|uniref:Protein-export membrane protein SecF n=1 Tax=Telmatocola sphagniphila TaxID=1123043 RepID=A0A8E6B8L9_9BACT|nr:protein translocase subunit SecD [Telmatocola sphagniphila]QVL33377.1 protein translocase subunit SecD [Telmatocola sphagniphila]